MRCPLFVELCAGTAAVSLRLQGGRRCRPPVSRMGAKTGYASEILALFGLTAGHGADAYLWCEPDDGARALLQALPQPDVLKEAAATLRGWKDKEPRALWERLRAEGPIRGCDGGEVARFILTGVWSYKQGQPESGFVGPGMRRQDTAATATATLALCVPKWPLVRVQNDAILAEPCDLPDGAICFIDPPYVATTGYKHDLGRPEVVDLAVRWANAGAFVGVSEQAPVEELIALGWHAVNLTNGRKGQKRTFSKQQEEWVTLSRPPVRVPLLGSQPSLFGEP